VAFTAGEVAGLIRDFSYIRGPIGEVGLVIFLCLQVLTQFQRAEEYFGHPSIAELIADHIYQKASPEYREKEYGQSVPVPMIALACAAVSFQV